jgi:hypothetical protein
MFHSYVRRFADSEPPKKQKTISKKKNRRSVDFTLEKIRPGFLTGAKRREFSGIIQSITNNNHPINPQQPIQQPYVKRTSNFCWENLDSLNPLAILAHHGAGR